MGRAALLCCLLLSTIGCRRHLEKPRAVHIPPGVTLRDRSFYSASLGREVTYRVIAPAAPSPGQTIRVVYLLHGNGGGFEEWSRRSSIAELAAKGYVLVMPEGHSSYFLNSVGRPQDRYEDFLTRDLIADAEQGLVVERRAIVGVSMGGFAALVLGFKHPELYGFVGALSPPVDVTERRFSWRRWGQSIGFRRIFGPTGCATRTANDPFVLVNKVDKGDVPVVFLGVGRDEPLHGVVERFAKAMTRQRVRHVFQEMPGEHDWGEWDSQLLGLEKLLVARTWEAEG